MVDKNRLVLVREDRLSGGLLQMGKSAGRWRLWSTAPVLFGMAAILAWMPVHIGHCEGPVDDTLRNMRKTEFQDIQCNKLSRDYFGYNKGSIPILISAPHGAKHYRTEEGRWKSEDAYTSSLAIELGRMTGAHVLYL